MNASLRQKIVLMISIFATVTPTILVSLLAYAYFTLGIETLFNEKISHAIENTVQVAESYMQEHKSNIRSDIAAIVNSIKLNEGIISKDRSQFIKLLDKQAELRKLSEIYVFAPDSGVVIAKNSLLFSLLFEKPIPEEAILQAKEGRIVILDQKGNEKVRAVMKLGDEFPGIYILIGKLVDKSILEHLQNTYGSADQYQNLISDINSTKSKLEFIFIASSAILCFVAIILGIRFAHHITRPINRLVLATERIKIGDYSVQLPEKQGKDEIATLTRAFNRMITKISDQREELIKFNNIINERRHFIEAVLAELSSGVITLDTNYHITLYNKSAADLLENTFTENSVNIESIFPEIMPMIEEAKQMQGQDVQQHLEIFRGGQKRHFITRTYAQTNSDKKNIEFIIIAFDDITDLVSAQRTAAWADVARRIAHEIKNPLTPIHLAAERLKKKYSGEITSDVDKFNKYIDTIIRHVKAIGTMAEEFSQFARIPIPVMKHNDLVSIIKDAIFSQEYTFKHIKYIFESRVEQCKISCDSSQILQVMINLLKNAAESINTKFLNKDLAYNGEIKVSLMESEEFLEIEVADNGIGFPNDLIDRIFEPYMTTKEQGTGLGLSIVKKVIEDHGGKIQIKPLQNGAIVKFSLQRNYD